MGEPTPTEHAAALIARVRNDAFDVVGWRDVAGELADALETAQARAERAEAALRESALAYHKSNSHPRGFDICTWPQCRKTRMALAPREARDG